MSTKGTIHQTPGHTHPHRQARPRTRQDGEKINHALAFNTLLSSQETDANTSRTKNHHRGSRRWGAHHLPVPYRICPALANHPLRDHLPSTGPDLARSRSLPLGSNPANLPDDRPCSESAARPSFAGSGEPGRHIRRTGRECLVRRECAGHRRRVKSSSSPMTGLPNQVTIATPPDRDMPD
jgi:hypothetical protein